MRQVHGIADARGVLVSRDAGEENVIVTDAGKHIHLAIGREVASLTPQQAQYVASLLEQAADRITDC